MFNKLIQYTDLDGKPAEKEYHFNLDEAELAKMQLSHRGDLAEYFKSIVDDKDGATLIEVYEDIIFKAVGIREENRLRKGQEVIDEFVQTGAYNAFFMELIKSDNAGFDVMKQILPAHLAEQAEVEMKKAEHTDKELFEMSDEDFVAKFGSNPMKWDQRTLQIAAQRKNRATP